MTRTLVPMKRSEDCQEVVSFYHVNLERGQTQLLSLDSKHIYPWLSSQPQYRILLYCLWGSWTPGIKSPSCLSPWRFWDDRLDTGCPAYNLPLFYNFPETLGLKAPRHYFPVQLCNQSNRERLVSKSFFSRTTPEQPSPEQRLLMPSSFNHKPSLDSWSWSGHG